MGLQLYQKNLLEKTKRVIRSCVADHRHCAGVML